MAGNAVKSALKSTIEAGMPLLTPLLARGPRRTRILTYHSVGSRDHEMNVRPDAFSEQMRWLKDHVDVISLDAAVRGEPGVAVTFDDGYRDNLTEAAPVLGALGIPATVFVVPGRVGAFLDHDTEIEDARLMTWEEISELREQGVDIGGHTMNHVRLSTLSVEEQAVEIGECARMLSERLGEAAAAFAYPFGSALDYNAASVAAVEQSGYRYAVSNRYGCVDPEQGPWEVRRIWIDHRDTVRSFGRKVSGALDGMAIFDSSAGIRCRRIMNGLLGVS